MFSKMFVMDEIVVGERKLFPIASMEINYLSNTFLGINYTVVAFKVIENGLTYWINNNLSKKEFKNIKRLVEEK